MADLSAFRRDLLVAVAACDGGSGYDAREHLSEWWGRINHARLYENLGELVDRGLVDKDAEGHNDRTKTYLVTDEGRAALQRDMEWRAELLD